MRSLAPSFRSLLRFDWRRLGQSRERRVARAAWALQPDFAALQDSLKTFGTVSNQEFTSLAENLTALDRGLLEVRRQAGQLQAVLDDHDDDRALHSTYELYRKSVDLAHASIGIALSQEEQMEQMEERLLQNRDQFAQHSLYFRVLIMNIRTEAARLDVENRGVFTTVAAEIEAMESEMRDTVETAFNQIESTVSEAASGRGKLQSMQGDLHLRAQDSTRLLRTELDKIKISLEPCVAASREITRLVEKQRIQTGELITSLQYQDIVRQQLEHVSDGFADILSHIQPTSTALDAAYLHQASLIQKRQLKLSRRLIAEAGENVRRGAAAMLEVGAELVHAFEQMEQVTEQAFRESKLSVLFAHETENLLQIAAQSDETKQRIAQLLERIEECVRTFATRIGHHEIEVQLVALNGQIAAARVPNAGALNRLAEATAELAGRTATLSHEVNAELTQTLERLRLIRQEAELVRDTIGQEKNDLAGSATTVRTKLARLSERIAANAAGAAQQFDGGYQQLRDFLPHLTFHTAIASTFDPAEALCQRLIEATLPFANQALGEEGSRRLDSHSRRYTMQQERDAHAASVVAGAAGLAATADTAASADGEIELFGDDPAPTPITDSNEPELFTADSDVLPADPTDPTAATPEDEPGSKKPSSTATSDGVELF